MAKTAEQEKTKDSTQSKGVIFIEKIKITPERCAIINYRTSYDNSSTETVFKGQEQVTEEFYNAFQSTVEGFVGCISKLSSETPKIKMDFIEFNYSKSDYLEKALYSIKYAFNDQNNAVINISTPLLPIYKEGMENTFCISGKHEEALHEVIRLAKAYINGETRTKQMSLIVDNTK